MHYFLGYPPYRTGGLTKYAMDLMKSQVSDGHVVMALWPGEIKLLNKKTCVKQRESIEGINNYELINPLPVSLDEGIKDFEEYMKSCDESVYTKFLSETKPDVIHIHTLMGLHKEFIDATEAVGIKTIFTTHDYFGICPKVTLYHCGAACENDHGCDDCMLCNETALSMKKIFVMQSSLYRMLKNSRIVKALRKKHRSDFFAEDKLSDSETENVKGSAESYKCLRAYYINMLERIGTIHFNSSVSEEVYKRYLKPKNGKRISITHKDIADNRKENSWQLNEKLRITCLAPAKPFKGFEVLKKALDEIWNSGNHKFELKLYSLVQNASEYMNIKEDGFTYSELKDIMVETDILVAPSIWYETFGFTVLEAISYGVPAIVSDHVGAKDVIGTGGIIVKAGSVEQLEQAIISLDNEKLLSLRREIKENVPIKLWPELVEETYQLYKV
jgi:glycosyltransferase involved in cell wall biosynthesis